jgi:hypothetical protein
MFEIGESLREARQRRAIEIAQAEQATKIRAKYLRALEGEQFQLLPSATYVKGFLKNYADFLGLDGQLYVDEYNSRFVVDEQSGRPRRSRPATASRDRSIATSIVMISLALIATVTLVVVGAWRLTGSNPPAKHPPAKSHLTRHVISHTPKAYLRILALDGPSYVAVHRNGPGGQILFQGTIEKGGSEPFQGHSFWLTVSTPANVSILVAGSRVSVPANKPAVLTVTAHGVHTA